MKSEKIVPCQRCNGAGHYYSGRTVVKCDDCGGTGNILQEFDSKALDMGGRCSIIFLLAITGAVSTLGIFVKLLVVS